MLYDTISELYDEIFPVTDSEHDFLLAMAKSYSSIRILDIGCGTGGHSYKLAVAGFEVIGIDAAPAMIAQAHRKAGSYDGLRIPPVFTVGDIRELHVGNEWADMVICIGNTLAHLTSDDDVVQALSEIRRVLQPGKPAVIQVVNYDKVLAKGKVELPLIEIENKKLLFYRSYEVQDRDNPRVVFRSHLQLTEANPGGEESLVPMLPLTLERITSLGVRAGFGVRAVYGNFLRSEFSLESPSLVIEFERE